MVFLYEIICTEFTGRQKIVSNVGVAENAPARSHGDMERANVVNQVRARHLPPPLFEEWLDRRHSILTFCLTQVFIGHDYYERFLCRIWRGKTTSCHHREDRSEDTVKHTLEVYPAWAGHRRVFTKAKVGGDLSCLRLVKAMLRSEGK